MTLNVCTSRYIQHISPPSARAGGFGSGVYRKRGAQGQAKEARDAGLVWAMSVVTGDREDGEKLDAMVTQRSDSCWPMGE